MRRHHMTLPNRGVFASLGQRGRNTPPSSSRLLLPRADRENLALPDFTLELKTRVACPHWASGDHAHRLVVRSSAATRWRSLSLTSYVRRCHRLSACLSLKATPKNEKRPLSLHRIPFPFSAARRLQLESGASQRLSDALLGCLRGLLGAIPASLVAAQPPAPSFFRGELRGRRPMAGDIPSPNCLRTMVPVPRSV